jgi:small-conductance mechanosensitive channel
MLADLVHDIARTAERVYELVAVVAPPLLLLAIVLALGAFAALVLDRIVTKLLRAFGFDVIADRTGFAATLRRGGVTAEPSALIGRLVGVVIFVATLVSALDRLEFRAALRFTVQLLADLRRGAVACLMVAVGMIVGHFASRFVHRTAQVAKVPFAWLLGEAAGFVVIAIVVVDALQFTGVAEPIVIGSFVILFALIPLLATVLMFVSGQTFVASYLAHRALRVWFHAGDHVAFGDVAGTVRSIGLLRTVIETPSGEDVHVPNAVLASAVVTRRAAGAGEAQNVPAYNEQERQTSGGSSESRRARNSP